MSDDDKPMRSPCVPTEAMIYAGAMEIADHFDIRAPEIARRVYERMAYAKLIQDALEKEKKIKGAAS